MLLRKETGSIGRRFVVASLLFLIVVGAAGSVALGAAQQSSSITVSAAISLKDALDELGPIFQVQQHRKNGGSGTAVTCNYGGSGTLARQIEQGAPVDVFFSAAEKQMDDLAAQGLIVADTRRDLVGNALVLIAPTQATPSVHNFQELTGPAVKTIALGETSTVPAGMYARQTLEHLGLFAAVEKKIVYAKDVRAVLTYVETGNADAGLVYQTDANTSPKVRVVAVAPADSHDPILYPAAVLRDAKDKAAARAFVEFLQGPDARAVFQKYGFTSAEKSAAKN